MGGIATFYNKLVADNNAIFELKKTAPYSPTDKYRLEILTSVHASKADMLVVIPFLSEKEIDSDMIDNAIQNYKAAWNQFKKVPGTSKQLFIKKIILIHIKQATIMERKEMMIFAMDPSTLLMIHISIYLRLVRLDSRAP